jgi:hypothetical protein
MSRKQSFVARADLDNWLTQELQKDPACKGCVLNMKYRLRERDADDCNWSEATIQLGSDCEVSYVRPVAYAIVARARLLFNVKD